MGGPRGREVVSRTLAAFRRGHPMASCSKLAADTEFRSSRSVGRGHRGDGRLRQSSETGALRNRYPAHPARWLSRSSATKPAPESSSRAMKPPRRILEPPSAPDLFSSTVARMTPAKDATLRHPFQALSVPGQAAGSRAQVRAACSRGLARSIPVERAARRRSLPDRGGRAGRRT